MSENNLLDIIKKAILLEHRGRALYQSVIPETQSKPVKELFKTLAEEERNHIEVLNKQFKALTLGGSFDDLNLGGIMESDSTKVLTSQIVKEISGAGYESAVIAAALEFEKKAVEFYSSREDNAESAEEKKLFQWLANWERGHMEMLAQLDRELMEQIWYDNSFWPLD